MMSSISHSSKLVLKVNHKYVSSCCWVCHGRFRDILPKEYPGAFYEVPWGLFKEMFTNTQGHSDIVTHPTNIRNYAYCCKRTFFYTFIIYGKLRLSKSRSFCLKYVKSFEFITRRCNFLCTKSSQINIKHKFHR
jgi:hypothetical protein